MGGVVVLSVSKNTKYLPSITSNFLVKPETSCYNQWLIGSNQELRPEVPGTVPVFSIFHTSRYLVRYLVLRFFNIMVPGYVPGYLGFGHPLTWSFFLCFSPSLLQIQAAGTWFMSIIRLTNILLDSRFQNCMDRLPSCPIFGGLVILKLHYFNASNNFFKKITSWYNQ